MKIASWNINSVRLREELILTYLRDVAPDVLCLQETKTINEHFPEQNFIDLGYKHLFYQGMKGYNGVAILSKFPFESPQIHNHCGKSDSRHISIRLKEPFESDLHCLYIPAGGDVPNPEENAKFAHKLAFVDELADQLSVQSQERPRLLLGDFNIAPYEHDVWSHRQLKDVVSHTEIEIEKLTRFQEKGAFIDAARCFVPMNEKSYSWWSYRARDWEKSNRGRRLDHIWVSSDLKDKLINYNTLKAARGWQPKPSDHVPIMLEIKP